jgi:hypothetical protein
MSTIELMVVPYGNDGWSYEACWPDGEVFVSNMMPPRISYEFLDLMPFIIARVLMEQSYNLKRLLVVRLQGADREMVRAPLAAVAATPLVNIERPVEHPHLGMKAHARRP